MLWVSVSLTVHHRDEAVEIVDHARVPAALRLDEPLTEALRVRSANVVSGEEGDVQSSAFGDTANPLHPSEEAQEALGLRGRWSVSMCEPAAGSAEERTWVGSMAVLTSCSAVTLTTLAPLRLAAKTDVRCSMYLAICSRSARPGVSAYWRSLTSSETVSLKLTV